MKVAVAMWNGRISPVFDVARQVLLLDVADGRVIARHEESLPGDGMQAQAARLADLHAEVLICGAISRPMASTLATTGVRVIPFTAGTVDDVIAAWLVGRLPAPALSMPGCCRQHRRCRRGRAGCEGPRTGSERLQQESI
ncbi:MAG: dinitrogenase iron-molybdenum cofactor biosynthesis protein [Lentisphaerae bacterium]|nr:dinitrogenase iron-molybdenum cofactor biosynthesis protein [Lentisphaerota bacterium]